MAADNESSASAGLSSWAAYDHSRFADWPEYRAIAEALDAFAHRVNREGATLTQAMFERLAGKVARNLLSCDCCPDCLSDAIARPPCAPHRARVNARGGLHARYLCEHGHSWETWYASRGVLAVMFG